MQRAQLYIASIFLTAALLAPVAITAAQPRIRNEPAGRESPCAAGGFRFWSVTSVGGPRTGRDPRGQGAVQNADRQVRLNPDLAGEPDVRAQAGLGARRASSAGPIGGGRPR